MMEGAEHHPDPLREATDRSKERVARIGSIASAATQVGVQLKAQHEQRNAARDEQAAHELRRQQRAEQQAARTRRAPAHDRQWLRQADIADTARVWGAAPPYADFDTVAASAMRKCEDRLRDLHPYAMARYDRLRAASTQQPPPVRPRRFVHAGSVLRPRRPSWSRVTRWRTRCDQLLVHALPRSPHHFGIRRRGDHGLDHGSDDREEDPTSPVATRQHRAEGRGDG